MCKPVLSILRSWDRASLEDVNNQQDATNSVCWSFYWSIWICSTCFGRQTRSSSRVRFDCMYSFWYNAPMLLATGDKGEKEFHLNLVTGRQQHRCFVPKAVYTIKKYSWGWASLSRETCRGNSNRSIKRSINRICWILKDKNIVRQTHHLLYGVYMFRHLYLLHLVGCLHCCFII